MDFKKVKQEFSFKEKTLDEFLTWVNEHEHVKDETFRMWNANAMISVQIDTKQFFSDLFRMKENNDYIGDTLRFSVSSMITFHTVELLKNPK